MNVLKHIDVLSAAKVAAVLAAIWGFIMAIIFIPIIAMAGSASSYAGAATGFNMAPLLLGLGVASIVIFPIIGAILGFICGAIYAFLYNVAAKYVGGIEIDLPSK